MHNQGPIDGCTHIDILILPAICSQQVYVLHWIICWYQNLLLLFKNHSLISHTSVRFSKTKFFPWNKKNTDRNDANEQKAHRHTRVSHSVGSGAWGHHHLPLILQFFLPPCIDLSPPIKFWRAPHMFSTPVGNPGRGESLIKHMSIVLVSSLFCQNTYKG